MASSAEIQAMMDEDALHELMKKTEDFNLRREIRQRMKQLREEKTAEWEKTRAERDACQTDVIALRQRQALELKERNMKALDEKAKEKREKSTPSVRDEMIKKKQETAQKENEEKIKKMTEMNQMMNQLYGQGQEREIKENVRIAEEQKNKKMASTTNESTTSHKTETDKQGTKTTTTTTTTTKRNAEDGGTVVNQTKKVTSVGGLGCTSYKIKKSAAEDAARRVANTFNGHCLPETSGTVTVRTENWTSRDGNTYQDESTRAWGGGDSARNAFKQLDAEAGGSPVNVQRSPGGIKQALLEWCKRMTVGYEHVNITNFSSSWNDGMAFCALIHHFYPRAFNYAKLNPKCRRGNFKLAFEVAEKLGGIAQLLDIEDMVKMKNPDWKCVFTYVQQFYGRFRNWEEEQAKKAEAEGAGGDGAVAKA